MSLNPVVASGRPVLPDVTRVERTFAFVDISSFTAYTDERGDGAAVAALAIFRQVVRAESSIHGVRVDKWLGDGAMFVGVTPAPVVETILAIENRLADGEFPLPLRAGITTGWVILFEGDDYIGTPVNLASRLCERAEPGRTLVTPEVAAVAPRWSNPQPARQIDVDGIGHPIAVVELRPPRT